VLRLDALFAAAEFRARAPTIELFKDIFHVYRPERQPGGRLSCE
jgi:hypothetical protein